jgi:hypothetical protein
MMKLVLVLVVIVALGLWHRKRRYRSELEAGGEISGESFSV